MNIQPCEDSVITGVVVKVADADFPALEVRDEGYDLVDVTDKISINLGAPVHVFMVRTPKCQGVPLSQKYLQTCMMDLSPEQHIQWLDDTVIADIHRTELAAFFASLRNS